MRLVNLLRIRHGHDHHRVTFVELFFDLVFVFAVTQLSHSLLENLTPLGVLQTAVLTMAVWGVWIYTSWATNWLDPDRIPVRIVLFAAMLAGLIISASIPRAFGDRGLSFALPLVALQLGRTFFVVYAMRADVTAYRNMQRVSSWLVLSGICWVAGGLAGDGLRLAFWLAALAVDAIGPVARFWTPYLGRSSIADWNVEGTHMAERCGLFVIIALGESILVTGATFSTLEWNALVVGAFVASFLGSVAMWWIYFNATPAAASRTIAEANDPGRLARSAYTYVHLVIVAGIIICAVADELMLAHPDGHVEPWAAAAIISGPAVYLIGIMLFKWTFARGVSPAQVTGLVLLALLVPLASQLSPLAVGSATTLVLILVAVWGTLTANERAVVAAGGGEAAE